jgi:hypothetical protein
MQIVGCIWNFILEEQILSEVIDPRSWNSLLKIKIGIAIGIAIEIRLFVITLPKTPCLDHIPEISSEFICRLGEPLFEVRR